MKTLLIILTLSLMTASWASQNMASDCTKTLHSEDRSNSKEDLDKKPEVETSGASATQQ
jgi:hypothetical protein